MRDPRLPIPDKTVNGWELFSQGTGWGYNVWALNTRTGRREYNFTSLERAAKWCADH